MTPKKRWTFGDSAGSAFTKDGDLWTSRWVTSPRGELKIMVTLVGFRNTDRGREKVILDRRIEDPPPSAFTKWDGR